MNEKLDPDGRRLPIKIDSATNGETLPIRLKPRHIAGLSHAHEVVGTVAKHLGLDRRSFLTSACGAAATLLALNEANAALGQSGGMFSIPRDAQHDQHVAQAALGKRFFVFDVQTHHLGRPGSYRNDRFANAVLAGGRTLQCAGPGPHSESDYYACFTQDAFVREIFLDSYTDVAVLTMFPSREGDMPLTMEEASRTRHVARTLRGSNRLILHSRVVPTQAADMREFASVHSRYETAAAKTYTQFYNREESFWLNDPHVMDPFVGLLTEVGIDKLCIHKGLTFPVELGFSADTAEFSSCRDVGPAARRYPGMKFIIYHSGYQPNVIERQFNPRATRGVDTLIRSLVENDIGPGSNVYAEMGGTWRYLMKDPDQAGHYLGKLLKYLGEDNIIWGTDSILFGSPQDQILAFQSFQFAPAFRERFGYPDLTDAIKAKIFGLNAARLYNVPVNQVQNRAGSDHVARARTAYSADPQPSFQTYGPRTRGEFLRLARLRGGH